MSRFRAYLSIDSTDERDIRMTSSVILTNDPFKLMAILDNREPMTLVPQELATRIYQIVQDANTRQVTYDQAHAARDELDDLHRHDDDREGRA